jgi:hypothetical protein|tara:strand:+ start:6621 stop:6782 length:162 start_codon:yes stop_codon:yes gene_type:complete
LDSPGLDRFERNRKETDTITADFHDIQFDLGWSKHKERGSCRAPSIQNRGSGT